MNRPDRMPPAVVSAAKDFSKRHNLNPVEVLSPSFLRWSSIYDCYHFTYGGVYYGIELDGYLHS